MKRIMIIGATSAIAHATARLFAADGASLFLVGRNKTKLLAVSDDLKALGANCAEVRVMDALAYEKHESIIRDAVDTLDGLDMVLIAYGELPNQKDCEHSYQRTRKSLETNCLSTISILTHLANWFEQKQSGTIIVISSVSGDRGRPSNYVYGTAKGALSIFLQGLGARLQKSSVTVTTVKPGYVDTPMTSTFAKNVLWVQPSRVAKDIYLAAENRKEVVYTPWYWRYILWVLNILPTFILRRLRL